MAWRGSVLIVLMIFVGCDDDPVSGAQCGGKICGPGDVCCGPPECGFCIDKESDQPCPATCPVDGGARDGASDGGASDGGAKDGPTGPTCGGQVCGPGDVCCGPPECGFCVPENSGVYCPPSCPDGGASVGEVCGPPVGGGDAGTPYEPCRSGLVCCVACGAPSCQPTCHVPPCPQGPFP